ncbi:hypothetical protein ACGFZK_19235 [Streptomyces sp. NPDC048257]|uniref:hypothetical protein n=1 Tax=Streptomyces sp. NPDC048257 TaxID=3365526 RepID=UPI003716D6E1
MRAVLRVGENYEAQIIAYRSAPPGKHIKQSVGAIIELTQYELTIPGAMHEKVPVSSIGALHHEGDTVLVVDAVSYTFALECTSKGERDLLAFAVALVAECNLYDADYQLMSMKALKKKYL